MNEEKIFTELQEIEKRLDALEKREVARASGLKYELRIKRIENRSICWSIKFEKSENDIDRELVINVAKNFFDALQTLETTNEKPDKDYVQLTRFQKGMLLSGECLAGNLYV